MSLNLMTGYAGEPHITSADDGAVNAAIYGASKYVLNTGQKFAYELISNNLIKIKDGYAINQGRKIGQPIDDYEELTIDNGLQGVKRSDIIAIRYSKNPDTGIESAEFIVIKGTSGDTYKDPALETGNIIQGDSVDDLPLYRVKIDGLSIATVEPMFNMLMSMQEMQDEIASNARAIDSLNSNKFKTGVTYHCDVYASITHAEVLRTTPIFLNINLDNISINLTKVELIGHGEIDIGNFRIIKSSFSFCIWSQNANIISGCGEKPLTVYFKLIKD